MSDQETAIQQFIEVTGSSEDEARFFLSSSKWDMNLAITSFFQSNPVESDKSLQEPVQSRSTLPRPQKSQRSIHGNVATLGSIGDPMDEDNSKATNPEYFAGGEKSGLSLQDPKKKREDTIQDILRKAAQPPDPLDNDHGAHADHFSGPGHRLGGEGVESTVVNPPNPQSFRPPKVTRVLNFWKDGISVGDGPLLRYDDPTNAAILNDINSGRAPLGLLGVEMGQPVDVSINKQLDQEYKHPKKQSSWEGPGYRLGSQIPDDPLPGPSAPPTTVDHTIQPELRDGEPVTSVQIRLSDGTRIVARANLSHTIGDLFEFITMNRQDMSSRNFTLQSSFPLKELNDKHQTIQDAKLQNAVVVQKMT